MDLEFMRLEMNDLQERVSELESRLEQIEGRIIL